MIIFKEDFDNNIKLEHQIQEIDKMINLFKIL